MCSVFRRTVDNAILDDALEQNLSWVVTETIHMVNNALGGIQYAVYFLQDRSGCSDGSGIRLIQERTDEIAMILRGLYELVNPLSGQDDAEPLDILCERIRSLLAKRIASQGVTLTADVPSHLVMHGRQARLWSQILYTYLWLRLGELKEGDTIELGVGEDDAGVWLRIADSGCSARVLSEEKNHQGTVTVENCREQFARWSLGQLASCLGPGGFRPLDEASGYSLFVDSVG